MVTNLVISSIRNDWGWFTASGFINGYLVSMRYDTRPKSQKSVKADLVREAIRKGIISA